LGTSAIGFFLLTSQTLVAAILGLGAIGFFLSQQLVKKSLALATNQGTEQLGSTLQKLEEVNKQLSKCKFLENIEPEGLRAASQSSLLLQHYKNLHRVLNEKFEPTEMTMSRYLEAINSASLSLSENLVFLAHMLANLNLTRTPNGPGDTAAWDIKIKEALELMADNDGALASLDHLYNSLNAITTKENNRNELDQSLEQIKLLADRAKSYSKK
jgi:hypothetical protein